MATGVSTTSPSAISLDCCSTCGKASEEDRKLQLCALCHFEKYCSKECQVKDWPQHRIICQTLDKESKIWAPTDPMATFYAQAFVNMPRHREAPLLVENFPEAGSEKMALDLGCGTGLSTLFLLKRGWKVVAIDVNRVMLGTLEKSAKAWIENGQLEVIQADIHQLEPTKKFDLVIASDVFPYLNPKSLFQIWVKIHQALNERGFFIGSFFDESRRTMEYNHGIWVVPNQEFVKQLLERFGYETKTLQNRLKTDNKSSIVEFLAQRQ
ncbi:MAG: hypothetical protein K940chlam2_01208 [Chlamydiae bacterium]|nr:hypothetical protein [Chlamydiota bacterium]